MVNEPGFPVAVVADGSRSTSLIAAGALEMWSISDEAAMFLNATGQMQLAETFAILAPRVIERERAMMRQQMWELRKIAAREKMQQLRK
jgi:hypothetical protein